MGRDHLNGKPKNLDNRSMLSGWDPPFQYECEQGHFLLHTSPLTRCCGVVRGSPCRGELHRVGPGSRGPRDRTGRLSP